MSDDGTTLYLCIVSDAARNADLLVKEFDRLSVLYCKKPSKSREALMNAVWAGKRHVNEHRVRYENILIDMGRLLMIGAPALEKAA